MCIPLFFGLVLPNVIYGILLGQWGSNLIWGHVFGFGWWLAQASLGKEHWRLAADLGILVWLPIMLVGLLALSNWLWRRGGADARRKYLMILGLSCLPMVPAKAMLWFYCCDGVPADFMTLMASW